MDKYIKRRIEWHKLLIEYFKGSHYMISLNLSNGPFPYEIKFDNILSSNINISERWGFLTLEFANTKVKTKFLEKADMIVSVRKLEGPTWFKEISTTYNKEKYPCRVYPASSNYTIAFYDGEDKSDAFSKEDIAISEFLAHRKSILDTIVSDIKNYLDS